MAAALADPFGIAIIEPMGFLLGRLVAGEAELLTIAVDPAARRQGIGAALVRQFLDQVRAKGGESVFLEVAETNLPARALYARHCFLPQGRRRAYYREVTGSAVDALVLVCAIPIPKPDQ
jgi:[ribosomal protein S18]-alanine N-acetyltransferase